MSGCGGRGVLANGSSRTPSPRTKQFLEGINLVVRAFKKEMQKNNRRLAIAGNPDASGRKSIRRNHLKALVPCRTRTDLRVPANEKPWIIATTELRLFERKR